MKTRRVLIVLQRVSKQTPALHFAKLGLDAAVAYDLMDGMAKAYGPSSSYTLMFHATFRVLWSRESPH